MVTSYAKLVNCCLYLIITISNIVKKYRITGSVENKKRSNRPKLVLDRDYRKRECLVQANRRDTLSNITSKFNENREIQVSRRTVQSHLSQHGFQKRVLMKKVVVKAEIGGNGCLGVYRREGGLWMEIGIK